MKFLIRFPSSSAPSRLRLSVIPSKSISTSSTCSSAGEVTGTIEPAPNLEPQSTSKIRTFPKSIAETAEFSHKNAVGALLSYKNDPQIALEYFEWAGKQRGFVREIGDSLFVLLHILVRFPNYHYAARSLIEDYVSRDTAPPCVVVVENLIKNFLPAKW